MEGWKLLVPHRIEQLGWRDTTARGRRGWTSSLPDLSWRSAGREAFNVGKALSVMGAAAAKGSKATSAMCCRNSQIKSTAYLCEMERVHHHARSRLARERKKHAAAWAERGGREGFCGAMSCGGCSANLGGCLSYASCRLLRLVLHFIIDLT